MEGRMRAWKLRSWRTAGVAALALAACGGEAGESGGGAGPAGEAGEDGATIAAPEEPVASAGGESGESGEAGAASAYAGLAGDQLTALRLEHLKGFLLIAEKVAEAGASDDAAVLVAQGLLEVYDPAPTQFGALNVASVRAVADAAGQPQAEVERRIDAALDAIDAARAPLQVESAALAARMVDIATGLYSGVVQADFVDPIEYQHSLGAALAAQDLLDDGEDALRRANRRAYSEADTEMDRFVALWPSPSAPETPAAYAQVLAQGSRVRLALSPYL
jgi:hypothetical protein